MVDDSDRSEARCYYVDEKYIFSNFMDALGVGVTIFQESFFEKNMMIAGR